MPMAKLLLEAWDNERATFFPAAQVSLVMEVERTAEEGRFKVFKDIVFEYLPSYQGPELDPWLPLEARETPFLYPIEEGEMVTVPDRYVRGGYGVTLREYRHLPPTLFQFAMGEGASKRSRFFYFKHLNAFETWWLAGGLRRGALRLRPLPGGYLAGMLDADLVARCDPASYRHEAFLARQPTSMEALAAYKFDFRFLECVGFAGECAKIPAQIDGRAMLVKVEKSLDFDLRRDALVPAAELANLNMARAAGLSALPGRVVQLEGWTKGLLLPDLAVQGRLPVAREGEAVEPLLKNRVLSLHEILRPLPSSPEYPLTSGTIEGWTDVVDEIVRWLPPSRGLRDELVKRYMMRQFLGDREGDMSDILLVSPAGESRWELGPMTRLRNSGLFRPSALMPGYYSGEGYCADDPGFYENVARIFSMPGLPLSEEEARCLAQPLLAVVEKWQDFYAEAGADVSAPEHQYTRFPGLRPPEVPPPPAAGAAEDFSLDWDDDSGLSL